MIVPAELAKAFETRFGRSPQIYRAPGRVNLIGEHTDYNDGFVLPMALEHSTWVAAAPRADRKLVVASQSFRETFTIDLDNQPQEPTESWIDYVRGTAAMVDGEAGHIRGAEMLIASDVPIGAGLSSSAALEIACGYALRDASSQPIDLVALALAGQRAEHEFVGMKCGVMDQLIACFGRRDHAMLLDTRTLDRRAVPLPRDVCVIVCNTMVRHALASSEYNNRRADCEAGVEILARRRAGVCALRDVSRDALEDVRRTMPDRVYRRCRHVIGENERTLRAADALAGGDLARFGSLMNASHQSLRDDYEVSCAELDAMASIARSIAGVYGARMTGGGFGGCVVALADASCARDVECLVRERYQAATGRQPDVWVCRAGAGVEKIA
jgi:galactokinase